MAKYRWESFNDKEILRLPIAELQLNWKSSFLAPLVDQLYRELDRKCLKLHPEIWLGEEWYCPDGVSGFAIPYYLMSPRLMKLHFQHGGITEGRSINSCMKLLRHETGHAVDNAYLLRLSKKRQKVFGLSQSPYPESYSPLRYSKKFVKHIGHGYSQSHPDEDWAETFAVWLNPNSQWKKRYRNWPALKKLILLDQLITAVKNKSPKIKRANPDIPFSKLNIPLGDFLLEMKRNKPNWPTKGLFIKDIKQSSYPSACTFLRKERELIIERVIEQSNYHRYQVAEVLDTFIGESRRQQWVLKQTDEKMLANIVNFVTRQTKKMNSEGRILM